MKSYHLVLIAVAPVFADIVQFNDFPGIFIEIEDDFWKIYVLLLLKTCDKKLDSSFKY